MAQTLLCHSVDQSSNMKRDNRHYQFYQEHMLTRQLFMVVQGVALAIIKFHPRHLALPASLCFATLAFLVEKRSSRGS
jgi:hypothetical protein